ncbi:MAG: hypothetical protein V3V08_07250 [Nannocystaceae bacterium]
MSDLEISKVLTISTGHITRRTAELMDAKEINLPVHYQWGEYGWIFWTGREHYEFDETPDDLLLCIMFAKDKGCRYLLLDRDGEGIDELPFYEW